jgi:excisionase family DNA binding protein
MLLDEPVTQLRTGLRSAGVVPPGEVREVNEPLFVSLQEAADMLCLSKRTLHRLVAEGGIPSVKVGRRRLFSRRKLMEWAESRA